MVFDGCTCKNKLSKFFLSCYDIYDLFLHMVHEKNVKIQIQATSYQHFGSN